MRRSNCVLLDRLIGAGEQRLWDRQSQCFRSLHVNRQHPRSAVTPVHRIVDEVNASITSFGGAVFIGSQSLRSKSRNKTLWLSLRDVNDGPVVACRCRNVVFYLNSKNITRPFGKVWTALWDIG